MAVLVEMLVLGECIEACAANSSCRSLNYETGLCVLFDTNADEHPDSLQQSDYPVFTIYAQKMCLEERVPCERAWISERVLGYELTGKKAKGRPAVQVSSRQECLALCLEQQNTEGGVPCRSANYNNQTGDCMLFEMDRTTLGSDVRTSFRRSTEAGAEYLESACVDEPTRLCQFRSLPGVLLKTADSVLRDVASADECRELCLSSVSSGASAPFRCRSYDWGSAGERVCRLSHLSAATATHVPSAYIPVPEASTWELSACYNVSVECGARGMVARVVADRLFGGKIYSRGNPKSCAKDVTAVMRFSLELPYDDVECGVRRGEARVEEPSSSARSGRKFGKDTHSRKARSAGLGGGMVGRYTTDVVIQHHDFIVTSADLGLAVTCQYDLTNKTVSNEIDLRVSGGAAGWGVDSDPSDPSYTPTITEVVVNSPEVAMRIVQRGEEDWGKIEGTAASAKVGDPLSLRFEIPEDSPFEIFVRHLVAMDGGDGGQIVLVDEEGCPTDQFIMGPLRKSANSPKILIADFDAFKFPTSEVVQFRALVTPCMPSCEPVSCQRYNDPQTLGVPDDDLRNGAFINSYGRKRRRREAERSLNERSVPESAEKYTSEQAQLAFQDVFEEEVEEAMQDGLKDAFHLAIHSIFGKRRKRSTEEPYKREENLLLVQSIRISDKFGPERQESTEDGGDVASCIDPKGLAFGSAAFVLAQVAIMVIWAYIRRSKDKKEQKKINMQVPPREVLFHGEAVWGMKRQRF